jgi:hypothetical protein
MIEGRSPEEIRAAFNLPDDLSEEQKLEPVRNVGGDPRLRLLNRLYAKKRKVGVGLLRWLGGRAAGWLAGGWRGEGWRSAGGALLRRGELGALAAPPRLRRGESWRRAWVLQAQAGAGAGLGAA